MRTYEWYRDHIQDFIFFAKEAVRQSTLKPFLVVEWADSHTNWSNAYRRGGIVAIQRPFNWAVKLGYIEVNPIRHIEKPRPRRREQIVTPEDWQKIKARYPENDPFRDLLEFCWESGCRPQEGKKIDAHHVDLSRMRVVFPPAGSQG